jgi:hypothetical protein
MDLNNICLAWTGRTGGAGGPEQGAARAVVKAEGLHGRGDDCMNRFTLPLVGALAVATAGFVHAQTTPTNENSVYERHQDAVQANQAKKKDYMEAHQDAVQANEAKHKGYLEAHHRAVMAEQARKKGYYAAHHRAVQAEEAKTKANDEAHQDAVQADRQAKDARPH